MISKSCNYSPSLRCVFSSCPKSICVSWPKYCKNMLYYHITTALSTSINKTENKSFPISQEHQISFQVVTVAIHLAKFFELSFSSISITFFTPSIFATENSVFHRCTSSFLWWGWGDFLCYSSPFNAILF